MRIGELGERVGVNPRTIRYYEGIGLLPEPERLPSGYREYTDDDAERLAFIKSAQRLGLSLSEIAEILGFRERAERPCDTSSACSTARSPTSTGAWPRWSPCGGS